MSVTRAGTLQTQSYLLEQINKNNAKYVDLSEQVSTGKKTQRYAGIADDAAMTVNLSNSQTVLNQYVTSADTTDGRISAVHNSLSTMIDIATSFRAQLIQAMSADQADDGRIDVVAQGDLKQVESALNSDLGGVYLFGGTKNDSPPVDLSDPVKNNAGTYYSGSDQLMQSRLDSNTVLSYGVTADFDGFKDLVNSLQRVTSASSSLDELKTSLDSLNSSLDKMTQLEAQIGHQQATVEVSKARNSGVLATIVNQLSGLRDVDISATMVELTQRQTILQASYSVIAKQNELSLVNYLR